ncbi:MAG TPA: choice-of-anchor tandem repeat GloVer-containing protein [Candidatus Dormibacteraeota bacterium]|nr:choice-of-anchor tandem repeat GloVer-containing protein [Candidatus Dormibacteraeota bacterium]
MRNKSMKVFGFFGRASYIGAAAALLAACGGPHSGFGAPVTSMPAVRSGLGPATSSEHVLYSFTGGNDGGNAATGLALDAHGNLYGTTVIGGPYTCGTVFELAPQPSPPWKETVLHNFTCYGDGKSPHGGVAFDPQGNLDGTTVAGGSGGACASDGCGVVYQLTPQTENVLHSFTAGNDGFGPGGGVIFDKKGNVYGTTPDGGADSEGVVYEVSHAGKQWHEHVIHTFTGGNDGAVGSLGSLTIDASGSLYGVTEEGGAHSAGTAFKLSRVSNKRWKLTTIYAFKGSPDAGSPYGGLVADAKGNLYGTTYYGGANGLGTVYELIHKGGRKYRERVLYSFKGGSDGSSSTTTLVFGTSADLYGTTSAGGGTCDCGTIFKLSSKSGTETVLHSFGSGTDGSYPYYGLTKDSSGNFYGTTVAGGSFGQGTVFKFTP